MIRVPSYLTLIAAAGAGLWLLARLQSRGRSIAVAPALLLTLLYGLVMVGWTVDWWVRSNQVLVDPPTSPVLAAVANGILLLWVVTAIVVIVDRHRHG